MGFTDDAELLLWAGEGADPPRHVGTFRLFQTGSAAPYGSDDAQDRLQCVTLVQNRVVAATRAGRVASFPMDEEADGTYWFQERRRVVDLTNDGQMVFACLGDGSILSMDPSLRHIRYSIRHPIHYQAAWQIVTGHAVYTVAPETTAVWCWPKSLSWVDHWPVSLQSRGWPTLSYGAHRVRRDHANRVGWDRLYIGLPQEVQIWEVSVDEGQRDLIRRLQSHTAILDIWETTVAGSLIIARQGIPAPPLGDGEPLLLALMTGLCEVQDFTVKQLELDAPAVCTLHNGDIVTVTKDLSRHDSGLTVHCDPAGVSPPLATVHGWPGMVLQLEAFVIPTSLLRGDVMEGNLQAL